MGKMDPELKRLESPSVGTGLETPGECFNDWGGRGYDNSVPGDGTKATPSGDKTT